MNSICTCTNMHLKDRYYFNNCHCLVNTRYDIHVIIALYMRAIWIQVLPCCMNSLKHFRHISTIKRFPNQNTLETQVSQKSFVPDFQLYWIELSTPVESNCSYFVPSIQVWSKLTGKNQHTDSALITKNRKEKGSWENPCPGKKMGANRDTNKVQR